MFFSLLKTFLYDIFNTELLFMHLSCSLIVNRDKKKSKLVTNCDIKIFGCGTFNVIEANKTVPRQQQMWKVSLKVCVRGTVISDMQPYTSIKFRQRPKEKHSNGNHIEVSVIKSTKKNHFDPIFVMLTINSTQFDFNQNINWR